jgi:hypothetical protein
MWDGVGTQADLYCNGCGQSEGLQVVDLFEQEDRPDLDDKTWRYPPDVVEIAKATLIEEWNKRVICRFGDTPACAPHGHSCSCSVTS